MLNKIIVYLHTPTDLTQASWVVTDGAGTTQQTVLDGNLQELASITADKTVTTIVIVPPEDVLLIQTKLPKLSRKQLQQALPYALEDQLLAEIHDLHFAIGEYQLDGTLPVAIVVKQKMDAWLTALKEAHLSPALMIPATLALPAPHNDWYIALTKHTAIARTDIYRGFSCDRQNLETLIELNLEELAQKPQVIYLNNYTDETVSIKTANIIAKTLPETKLIADMAREAEKSPINLLQGAYREQRKTTHSKKIWITASYLTLSVIAILFFSNVISFFILHHQASTLQSNIKTIYMRHFPEATDLIAPKERMSAKLNKLLNKGKQNRSLLWLAYIGKSLSQKKLIQIQQLDFRNNQLNLDVSAPAFDNIDAFTQSLTQQGLSVKQQNVAAAGSQVKGTLIITDGNDA